MEESKKTQSKGYDKNIVANVAKKVISMMFNENSKYVAKKCRQANVNYRHFKKIFKGAEEKLTGPIELFKLFKMKIDSDEKEEMKRLF